jgi:hypothetical protein
MGKWIGQEFFLIDGRLIQISDAKFELVDQERYNGIQGCYLAIT